jgi:hypothetical protein
LLAIHGQLGIKRCKQISWWPSLAPRVVNGTGFRDRPLGSSLGFIFQLSLDVRYRFTRTADAGAAVDQDRLLQATINLPNRFKFSLGKGWMLVVTNWNVRNVEPLRTIVRKQSDSKILVQSKLLAVEQSRERIEYRIGVLRF